jgi:hypothetical protein
MSVEQVGGTADSNPWHDHRVVLLSPAQAVGIRHGDVAIGEQVYDAFCAAPAVWHDEDAIRWLTSRQMQRLSRCACGKPISYGRGDSTRCPDCWDRERVG